MEKFDVQNLVELNNNLVSSIAVLTNGTKLLNTMNTAFIKQVSEALEHIQRLEEENERLNRELNDAKAAINNYKDSLLAQGEEVKNYDN